jgi:purine-binding chemotaxis protein CheW
MSSDIAMLSGRAEALRQAFDRAFAQAPAAADEAGEGMLALRAGGEAFAVPLAEVHGLFADRRLVALPGPLPAFRGIACLRSGIVAVYGLADFFGHPSSAAPMRWMLLTGGRDRPFALAFEHFDGYARAAAGVIAVSARDGHIRGSALIAGARRAILSLSSIAAAISAKP